MELMLRKNEILKQEYCKSLDAVVSKLSFLVKRPRKLLNSNIFSPKSENKNNYKKDSAWC